jgi:regulator of protease activity HflC (stomatin/prohibitin superfamily)
MVFAWIVVILIALAVLYLALAVKVVKQYEQAVLFRLGRVVGVKGAGLKVIVPVIDILHRVSLRIVTMPIQSQGITCVPQLVVTGRVG